MIPTYAQLPIDHDQADAQRREMSREQKADLLRRMAVMLEVFEGDRDLEDDDFFRDAPIELRELADAVSR